MLWPGTPKKPGTYIEVKPTFPVSGFPFDVDLKACENIDKHTVSEENYRRLYQENTRLFCELTRTQIREIRLERSMRPRIENVIFNDPATIVFWEDGSKTVVKCQPGDTFSKELGLAMAICKKVYGNKGNYNDMFKKWVTPDE